MDRRMQLNEDSKRSQSSIATTMTIDNGLRNGAQTSAMLKVRTRMPELEPTNLFAVRGLVVVVTGGGTGIGLMMAKALENNGATVYIVGRRQNVLEKAAEDNNRYGNIIPLVGDVTSRKSLLDVTERVEKLSGYVDVLVNNAGIARNFLKPWTEGDDIKSFQQRLWNTGTPEEFSRTLDTNATSVYYTTVAFLELLHKGNTRRCSTQPTSQVITISSGAAFRRDARVVSLSYSMSKAAVTQLGKTLANLLAPCKIRSNIIAPGIFPSEATDGVFDLGNVTEEQTPLARAGNIEDIGGLVIYLVSQAGGYANGGVFLTDGGRLGLFPSTY